MPSTAGDAAGLVNAAFASARPTVLFSPKALLNDRARMTSADVDRQFVPVGRARVRRQGNDLTIVAWGNTAPIAERAADALAAAGAGCDVLDLRWLSPWDKDAVCDSVRRTRRLLVVHEDNLTGGFGAEILATVAETVGDAVAMRRVGRMDTFVPCHFGSQLEVLPSFKRTLTAAAQMLDLELSWVPPPAAPEDRLVVTALGSSPSDQRVQVVELHVKSGDPVRAGQVVASLEADKAIMEVSAPADGIVEQVHLGVGESAAVESPILTLQVARARRRQPMSEQPGAPLLGRRRASVPVPAPRASELRPVQTVVIAGISACRGNGRLTNEELAPRFPQLGGAAGIFDRTGIEERVVADATQDVVSMAADAARELLRETGVGPEQLSLIICSTSTPMAIAPSTACSVLHRIAPGVEVPAYDVLAACSGYLYGMANAWDFLRTRPGATVLLLTTETMRRVVDIDDADTSPVFADAATATLLTTKGEGRSALAVVNRPVLSARGESGASLKVPVTAPKPPVHMDGKRVFAEATRRMEVMLKRACAEAGISIQQLDMVVPHQANGRIIEAMRSRLGLPSDRVVDVIRRYGNTSSSSIPLALDEVFRSGLASSRTIGLCAFGAGYTFAATTLVAC